MAEEKLILGLGNPPHVLYDPEHCPGIFMSINENGTVICNECGMTIMELCEKLAGR